MPSVLVLPVSMPWLVPCNDETPDQNLWDLVGNAPCKFNDLPEDEEEDDSWADDENWEEED